MRLPTELGLGPNVVRRLLRFCYDTRSGGAISERFYADSTISLGVEQGRASPCCSYNPVWEISVAVHGDDLTVLGSPDMLDQYGTALKKCFDVKIRGRLGEHEGDDKEILVPNRIIKITATWVGGVPAHHHSKGNME